MYRQKRGKRIARGSKKVSGWATLDVVLYLECQAAKLQGRPEGPTQRPSLGLTPSQAPTRRPYVSVQSDERAHQLSMASPYTQIHAGGSRGWGVKGTVPGHKHTGVIHAGRAPHQGLHTPYGQDQPTAAASPPALSIVRWGCPRMLSGGKRPRWSWTRGGSGEAGVYSRYSSIGPGLRKRIASSMDAG